MKEIKSDIVELNKDVEPLLLASAKCGIHGRGKEDVGKLFTLLACFLFFIFSFLPSFHRQIQN